MPLLPRALRIDFVTASIIPYLAGAFLAEKIDTFVLIMGGLCVIFTHLAANLMNEYGDYLSGVDGMDITYYGLFGGSKLIQTGDLSPDFFLHTSVYLFMGGILASLLLSAYLNNFFIVALYVLVGLMAAGYSFCGFPKFSYRRLGELMIFILFGPATVVGGYYLQTQDLFNLSSFVLSVPFGLIITSILAYNEVPDYSEDSAAGKNNVVNSFPRDKGYVIYGILIILYIFSITLLLYLDIVSILALTAFLLLPLPFIAAKILKTGFTDKSSLYKGSGLNIAFATITSLILMLSVILN